MILRVCESLSCILLIILETHDYNNRGSAIQSIRAQREESINDMSSKQYHIKGQIIDIHTSEGIEGLRVEAWDKDTQKDDDFLGEDTTKQNGEFEIQFDQSAFSTSSVLPANEGPDIYYYVFSSDTRILSTENSVQWNVKAGTIEARLEVDGSLIKPPEVAAPPEEVSTVTGDRYIEIQWKTVEEADSYNLYWSTEASLSIETGTQITEVSSPFRHEDLANGTTYYYAVTSVNEAGESILSDVVTATPVRKELSPPPLDQTVATTLNEQIEFLYTGDDPIQKEVNPEVIEPRRVAVLRGTVQTADKTLLSGVTVTVCGHDELGYTTTRSDGMFDMAVNGGGQLTVQYEKEGYLTTQRRLTVPWQDYEWVSEVVLLPADDQIASIKSDTEDVQVAQATPVSDDDGARQPTLLVPSESMNTVEDFTLQITEYTVGEQGPEAMPAQLPPASGYTYAVEFTAEGAENSRFEPSLAHYVENFLDFPVGGAVPTGYYDRDRAAWIPANNGRIIEVLEITNGFAILDINGSGQAADANALKKLGVTDDERQELSTLYQPGQSLWRVPIPHFSPWDCNWPYGPPEDADPPELTPEPEDDPTPDPC